MSDLPNGKPVLHEAEIVRDLSKGISKKELEAHAWSMGAHNGFLLHAKCHMDMPLQAFYYKGSVSLVCAACGKMATKLKLAEE